MYNSVLYRKTSKERWVHCLVTKAFFTWPTGVYKKNSLNFKQISVLMLGSLSRWLTIMVVAARWKVSQIWPIFQLIWNQSISLKSLKIIEMFFSKFNFFFALKINPKLAEVLCTSLFWCFQHILFGIADAKMFSFNNNSLERLLDTLFWSSPPLILQLRIYVLEKVSSIHFFSVWAKTVGWNPISFSSPTRFMS